MRSEEHTITDRCAYDCGQMRIELIFYGIIEMIEAGDKREEKVNGRKWFGIL